MYEKIMYHIYVDESGRPTFKDSSINFTLCGVIVKESNMNQLNNSIIELKKHHFGDNHDNMEYHFSDMIRRKKDYRIIPLDKRTEIIKEWVEFIIHSDITIFSTVINKQDLYKKDLDIEKWAWIHFYDRLHWNIEYLNKNNLITGKNQELGILIYDSINLGFDYKLKMKIRKYLVNGTRFNKSEYLIEDVLFTCSHWHNFCQIADCFAYIISYNNKMQNLKDERMHKILVDAYPKIIQKMSEKGDLKYSFKIFPKKRQG